ncbi:MAG: hypothetical protein U0326_07390 [Polyangiales bacterium]
MRDAITAEVRRLPLDQVRIVLDLVRLFARAMNLPVDEGCDKAHDPA